MRFDTLAVHAGGPSFTIDGAHPTAPPLVPASSYWYESADELDRVLGDQQPGYSYARYASPTVVAFEEAVAALEEAPSAVAFASGMAAEATIMHLLKSGDHVVAGDDLYGGTYRLFTRVLENYGLHFTYVDPSEPDQVREAMRPETRMVWIESPTNPLLKVVDIRAVAGIARGAGATLVVDNTFATPYFQQPLALGADIVVHSATKYLGGHSDLVMGMLATSSDEIQEALKFHQNAVGGVPGPFDSWLLLRGLKTLALRMARHQCNALAVARFLQGRPQVRQVIYPGLREHPQHELAARQMSGFSGIVTLELEGGEPAARQFLKKTQLFLTAESLGGVESLADHPAIMTHASVPIELRDAAGITGGLIRLSVGIEDEEDLIADVQRALN